MISAALQSWKGGESGAQVGGGVSWVLGDEDGAGGEAIASEGAGGVEEGASVD